MAARAAPPRRWAEPGTICRPSRARPENRPQGTTVPTIIDCSFPGWNACSITASLPERTATGIRNGNGVRMSETATADLPRDFDGLRALILGQRESLPKRIAQIAAYALDNPDEIAFGTAAIMRLRTRWARIWRSFALISGLPSEFLNSSLISCFVIFWRWYQL